MKTFKNLIIPNGIVFSEHAQEDSVGDERVRCSCISTGGIDVDYWEGVKETNPACRGISCCNCIFYELNSKERLEYFKEMNIK